MRLDEIINTHRQSLNDTDMVIWKYILQHREVARHISIHELAKACCVSSTTIVRFAQKLGLDGFGELKAILKMEEAETPRYSSNVLEDLSDFYLKTGEKIFKRNFDSASRLVHEAMRAASSPSSTASGLRCLPTTARRRQRTAITGSAMTSSAAISPASRRSSITSKASA